MNLLYSTLPRSNMFKSAVLALTLALALPTHAAMLAPENDLARRLD